MVSYSNYIIPNKQIIHSLLSRISAKSITVQEVVSYYNLDQVTMIKRSLCWLLKMGIIRIQS